jgi:hypothetical protein
MANRDSLRDLFAFSKKLTELPENHPHPPRQPISGAQTKTPAFWNLDKAASVLLVEIGA